MKNIHLIPTDKPSTMFHNDNQLCFRHSMSFKEGDIPQDIYITSHEEIKEGDWFIDAFGITKNDTHLKFIGNKVILTIDQDLIKEGVQAIDDEFLEWFVKNPSCEEVKVVDDKKPSSKNIYNAVEGDLVYSHHGHGGIINSLSMDIRVGIDNYIETAITSETGWETLDINNYRIYDKCYKIIIPKEEPKQDWYCPKCDSYVSAESVTFEETHQICNTSVIDKEEPKQETLEEITEQIQKDCHKFVESVTNVTYQDATNTFLFMKLAELTLKLKKYEK